ncbi:MAG: DUF89 family protein [Clostridiaceae bacterium]|nr:DUF89 family protein [Clostridiaceae bacterium]
MRSYIDCVHCYLRQVVTCMVNAGVDEDTQYRVIYEMMDYVKGFDINDTPAENSSKALLKAYELIGVQDPFEKAKKESNDLALSLYPKLKEIVKNSEDSLYQALKVAVAGNIIDLGINRSYDIDAALQHSLKTGFSKNDYEFFVRKLQNTKEVLFLGDNAGEIVFDRLLVEELVQRGKKVTYVVKDGPVLNDSTLSDAIYASMDKVAEIITTGSNFLGVSLKRVPESFLDRLKNAELIISKGQANFESLESEYLVKGKIFFLLKIKCYDVGRVAEAEFGDVVFIAG